MGVFLPLSLDLTICSRLLCVALTFVSALRRFVIAVILVVLSFPLALPIRIFVSAVVLVALLQTDGYLRGLGVVKEQFDDTAGAAQAVSQRQLKNVGAVASRRAAEMYGLEVLAEGIQDETDNVTRFIVLSRDPVYNNGNDARPYKTSVVFSLQQGPDPVYNNGNDTRPYKTSVVFSLQQGPGMLFNALSVFALRKIDLTKIESRPLKNSPLMMFKTVACIHGTIDLTKIESRPLKNSPLMMFKTNRNVQTVAFIHGKIYLIKIESRSLKNSPLMMFKLGGSKLRLFPTKLDLKEVTTFISVLGSMDLHPWTLTGPWTGLKEKELTLRLLHY
eukprot:gene30935-35991_t